MHLSTYLPLAMRTLAPNVDDNTIRIDWPENACAALNGASGLSTETGEINEIVKKWLFHGHPMDDATLVHLRKELGDLMWYVALMCHAFQFNPDKILAMNIEKLKARYPAGFSTERSITRAPGDI